MTPEHQSLLTVLATFVAEVGERGSELADLADREAAEAMASWPIADDVRQATAAAAHVNGYLDESADDLRVTRPAGRPFSAEALHRLGIAGLLRAGHQVDTDTLVRQVASYLAGPPIRLWRHVVLDVDWDLPTPVEIAGWRLWRPSGNDWDALRPVPAAADYAAALAWDPLLRFGEHVVLSVPDTQATPIDNRRIWLFPRKRTVSSPAWTPFLILNLWDDIPVSAVAEHLIEPGRWVDKLYSSIPGNIAFAANGEEVEVPQLGPLHINDLHGRQVIRFLEELSICFQRWDPAVTASSKKKRAPYDRLLRSAMRFLETGDKVGFDNDVTFPEDRPMVVFSYVSALENLLSANEGSIDLRRRTAQRAAILLGQDDGKRKAIYDQVFDAYDVRNKIAHGDEPIPEKLATAVQLRTILREAIIAAIVLGPQRELSILCDDALLSQTILREKIQIPLDEFRLAIKGA